MRKLITIALVGLFALTAVSCATTRHDNGKHKGWYKNPNNPHHPFSNKKKKKKPKHAHYRMFQEHTGQGKTKANPERPCHLGL